MRARRSAAKAAWAVLCSSSGRLEHAEGNVRTEGPRHYFVHFSCYKECCRARSAWNHEKNNPVPAGRLNGSRLRSACAGSELCVRYSRGVQVDESLASRIRGPSSIGAKLEQSSRSMSSVRLWGHKRVISEICSEGQPTNSGSRR
jgi:hypothetical protein